MKTIVFKIIRNHSDHGTSMEYMNNCDEIIKSFTNVGIGNITNLSEYNDDYFILDGVSTMEDATNYYGVPRSSLALKIKMSGVTMFENKTILELKDYNIFKYLGNSRIDGHPIFLIDDDTCISYRRDLLIKELGI